MSIQEQSETKYNASDSPSKAGSVGLWFLFFLGLCLLTAGLWSGWQDYTQASKNQGPELAQRVVPAGLPHATMDKSAAKPGMIEIRKIQPGMRVEAFNPEVSDEERESWPTIDHKRWFALSVLLMGSEGEPVYLELIRPVEWVLALDAQEGHEVWLELPELNSKGWGRVTKLKRCQPFEEGPGRVVTGTFTRQVRNVVNLHVEGLKAPIGVTQNHPIWSEDRQAFVQAGSLQSGERLRSMIGGEGGGIAHVTAITPRGPPGHRETVFNLEVEGEHAYQVSGLGLVVHNNYASEFKVGLHRKLVNLARLTGLNSHHAGQKALMKKLVKGYDELNAPAILVSKYGHTIKNAAGDIISRSTKGITSARQLLARDIKELRRVYKNVPNSVLRELVKLNKEMYREMRRPKRVPLKVIQ